MATFEEALPHVEVIPGEWKGESAGGCINNSATFGNNPQYALHLAADGPTEVYVSLRQRGLPPYTLAIGGMIVRKGGERAKLIYSSEEMASTGQYINIEEVSMRVALPPQTFPYTLVVTTFDPGEEGAFEITVRADRPFRIEEMLDPTQVLSIERSVAGEWRGPTAGGCFNFSDTCVDNVQYGLTVGDVPTTVFIRLVQRPPEGIPFPIGFSVQYLDGKKAVALIQSKEIGASGSYVRSLEVSCKVVLDPRPHPYTLFCSTFNPGQEATYTLYFNSDGPVHISELTEVSPMREYLTAAPGDVALASCVSEWRGATAGGSVNNPTCKNNPQFLLRAPVDGLYKLILRQQNVRPHPIALFVLDTGGTRARLVRKRETLGFSGNYINSPEVVAEVQLRGRDQPYTLLPTAWAPGDEGVFSVIAMGPTGDELTLTEAAPDDEFNHLPFVVTVEEEWSTARGSAGGSFNYETAINNPQFALTVSEPTNVVVILDQKPPAGGGSIAPVAVSVVNKNGALVDVILEGEDVATSGNFVAEFDVRASGLLEPLPHAYTIFVSTFEPGHDAPFLLTIRSDKEVAVVAMDRPVDLAANLIHSTSLDSAWAGESAGGCLNFRTASKNPQFFLYNTLVETDVVISLSQEAMVSRELHPIGLVIADKGGKVITSLTKAETVGTSGSFATAREAVCAVKLAPRPYPYTVLPSTFEPGLESEFRLTVHSSAPITLESADGARDDDALTEAYTLASRWAPLTSGGCWNSGLAAVNPQFTVFVSRPTTVRISLTQEADGEAEELGNLKTIGFVVFRGNGGRVIDFVASDVICQSPYLASPVVTADMTLEPAPTPYVLSCTTYQPCQLGGFSVDVRSDAPLQVLEMPDDDDVAPGGSGAATASSPGRESRLHARPTRPKSFHELMADGPTSFDFTLESGGGGGGRGGGGRGGGGRGGGGRGGGGRGGGGWDEPDPHAAPVSNNDGDDDDPFNFGAIDGIGDDEAAALLAGGGPGEVFIPSLESLMPDLSAFENMGVGSGDSGGGATAGGDWDDIEASLAAMTFDDEPTVAATAPAPKVTPKAAGDRPQSQYHSAIEDAMAEIMAATSTLNDFGLAPGVAPLPVTAVSPVPDVAPVMDVKPVAFDMDPVGGGANVVKVNEATALPRNVAVLRPAVQEAKRVSTDSFVAVEEFVVDADVPDEDYDFEVLRARSKARRDGVGTAAVPAGVHVVGATNVATGNQAGSNRVNPASSASSSSKKNKGPPPAKPKRKKPPKPKKSKPVISNKQATSPQQQAPRAQIAAAKAVRVQADPSAGGAGGNRGGSKRFDVAEQSKFGLRAGRQTMYSAGLTPAEVVAPGVSEPAVVRASGGRSGGARIIRKGGPPAKPAARTFMPKNVQRAGALRARAPTAQGMQNVMSVVSRVFSATTSNPEFQEMLLDPKSNLTAALAKACSPETSEEIAMPLLHIFEDRGAALRLIQALVESEVEEASERQIGSIFLRDSLAGIVMACYLRLIGFKYLAKTMNPLVRLLTGESMMDPEASYEEHYFKVVVDAALRSIGQCPLPIRMVCYYVRNAVERRFPGMGNAAVNNVFFGRFLITAIREPHVFRLLDDVPPPAMQLSLDEVADAVEALCDRLYGTGAQRRRQTAAEIQQLIDGMEEAVWAFFDELADMDDRTIVTATALFDFDAQEPNEISFSEGALITEVEGTEVDDWLRGTVDTDRGLFPTDYVVIHEEMQKLAQTEPIPMDAATISMFVTMVRRSCMAHQEAIVVALGFPTQNGPMLGGRAGAAGGNGADSVRSSVASSAGGNGEAGGGAPGGVPVTERGEAVTFSRKIMRRLRK